MSEIVILMENPNKPPFITLNGQPIRGVIELRYEYDSKANDTLGRHNFEIKYLDDKTKTIRTATVSKIFTEESILPTRFEGSV